MNKCSVARESEATAQQYAAFKEYHAGPSNSLEGGMSSLNKKISTIRSNIEEIASVMRQLRSLIGKLDKNIKINKANIRTIEGQISRLSVEVKKKQKDIDQRSKIITDRMLDKQVVTDTNMDMGVIMSSKDLVDVTRKMDSLQGVADSDQVKVKKLQEDKAELDHQKSEKNRLKADMEAKKAENKRNKKETEKVQKQKKRLLEEHCEQEVELDEEIHSVQVDIASIQDNTINISASITGKLNFDGNGVLMVPIRESGVSTDTWYYPDSEVHLGLDIATSISTSLVAPADGAILYAGNSAPTNGGFLNNWIGYPADGGNTIQMLTQADGATYAINFSHLSEEGFAVSGGS